METDNRSKTEMINEAIKHFKKILKILGPDSTDDFSYVRKRIYEMIAVLVVLRKD